MRFIPRHLRVIPESYSILYAIFFAPFILIRSVSEPYSFKGEGVRISASIGVAGYPEAGAVDHELLRMADLAMYQAKDAGKGRVVCASPSRIHLLA